MKMALSILVIPLQTILNQKNEAVNNHIKRSAEEVKIIMREIESVMFRQTGDIVSKNHISLTKIQTDHSIAGIHQLG